MGQTGPCFGCGTLLVAPIVTDDADSSEKFSQPVQPTRVKAVETGQTSRRRGMVMPDANIDRRHEDRREMWLFIRVAGLLVAVICACVAVMWYMKQWFVEG